MAAPSKVRTRHKTECKLTEYLSKSGEGTPKELLSTELPTLRAVLLLGLHLQEQKITMEEVDKRNYSIKDLSCDLADKVLVLWVKANAMFKSPVIISKKALSERILKDWELAQKVAKNCARKKDIVKLEEKLDLMYDLTKCKCHIMTCAEFGKCADLEEKCKAGFHIICHCIREEKLPVLDLGFLISQRSKVGEKGGMQITGMADRVESDRQENILNKKSIKEDRKTAKDDKESKKEASLKENAAAFYRSECVPGDDSGGGIPAVIGTPRPPNLLQKRNMVDISQTAQTAIRYETGSREAAAIVTSFLGDLIKSNILSADMAYLAVDQSKMQRAKDAVMAKAKMEGEATTRADQVNDVMFDSRIDPTLVKRFDQETQKYYPRVEKEDHYTVTDGAGRYLHHLTKPGKADEDINQDIFVVDNDEDSDECDECVVDGENNIEDVPRQAEKKPAEKVADLLLEWMRDVGVDESLQFLSADSTNSNTGWKAGIITWIEKKLGRKVNWKICALHTNELLLRHLMELLDGKTDSKTGFSGQLGKLLKLVADMKRTQSFKKIDLGPDLIALPDEVVNDLSTDQELSYKLVKAIRSGHLPRDIAMRKPGAIVHSRWLTFAENLCFMWMSDHGLEGELYKRLEMIVTFVVSVYFPMWFNIKVKHSWLEGPRHILTQLSLIHLQSIKVQRIVMPYARSTAWFSHSEAVLQTMLCSSEQEDRVWAVEKILQIRGKNPLGSTKPRARRLPKLNVKAKDLKSLISWTKAHEPLLTCNMNKEELKELKNIAMVVPYYCLHTQGIERGVKEVTQASEAVYGFERRDGFIRARAANRKLMPKLNTKKNLEGLLA